MDHPERAGSERGDRVDFDLRVRLEFKGTRPGPEGGLPVMREPDDAPGLSGPASAAMRTLPVYTPRQHPRDERESYPLNQSRARLANPSN